MPLKVKVKAKKKTAKVKASAILVGSEHFVPVEVNPVKPPYEPVYEPGLDHATFNALKDRVAELEGDLVRVVQLIVMGDIDSAKFKEILAKRQGVVKS